MMKIHKLQKNAQQFARVYALSAGLALTSGLHASPVTLPSTWGEYDYKQYLYGGSGNLALSDQSATGFTAQVGTNDVDALNNTSGVKTSDGNVDSAGRPVVYQEFTPLDLSRIGEKVTATFNLKFNNALVANDQVFRFGFGNPANNSAFYIKMDAGQGGGDILGFRSDSTMTGTNGLTLKSATFDSNGNLANAVNLNSPTIGSNGGFVSGFYSDFLNSGAWTGNAYPPNIGGGAYPNGVGLGTAATLDVVHTISLSMERVAGGLKIAASWYNSAGSEVATSSYTTPYIDADAPTGHGSLGQVGCLGFYASKDVLFTGGTGSYTVSNFSLDYTPVALATTSYSNSGFTVDSSQDLALNVSPIVSGPTYSTNLASLTDGQAPNSIPGYDGLNHLGNGAVLTYDLGSEATINEIQSYSAWPGDRYLQDYTVDFSQDGFNWTNGVVSVVNQGTGTLGGWNNVKVSVTNSDNSPLASNARYVRFNFPSLQNGAVAFTEFVINGVSSVLPEAPVFTEIPQSQTVTSGGSVTFTAQATGYPIPTITWHFIDSSSVDQTLSTVGNTLTFTSSLSSAGQYYAVASNSVGTVNSTPNAVLTVNPNPVVATASYSSSGFTVDNSQDLALNVVPSASGNYGTTSLVGLSDGLAPNAIPQYDGQNTFNNGVVLTFDLGSEATINEIQSYSAWPGDRYRQDYTVDFSVDGFNWTNSVIAVVNAGTSPIGSWNNVKVSVARNDSLPLASNARYVRFNFNNQQNSAVAYTEFVINGIPFALPEAPVFTEIPQSQTVTSGDSVTLTAQATGYPVPVIAWHFIDSSSVNHTLSTVGNTLTFTAHLSSAGQYYAVATNSAGTVSSTPTAVLTVNPGIVENGDFSENAAAFTEGNSYFAAQSPGNPAAATAWTGGSGINGTLGSAPDYFGPANKSIPSYLFMQGAKTLTQNITTTVGKSYRFTFKAACREGNTVGLTVWADNSKASNLTIADGSLSGSSFQEYSFDFTGSGTQTIQFVNSGTDDFTADLTGIKIVDLGWADPLASWISGLDWSAFTNPDKTATGDPDGDGMNNQQEFAFGLDPRIASSVNPITQQLDHATGTFSYTRRATPATTGLTYTVLTSTDLVTWTTDAGTAESIATSGDVQTVTFTVSNPAVNGKLFVRVKAQ